jgi:hypothetical protein
MNTIISGGMLAVAGTSVIGTVAASVATSTGAILSFLWYGSETNLHLRDYHRRLMKLDIQDKINIVNQILDNNQDKKTDAVRLLEPSTRAITEEILRSLQTITGMLDYHKTKWFAGYRNIYLDEELKDLEAQVEVLDRKLSLLLPL